MYLMKELKEKTDKFESFQRKIANLEVVLRQKDEEIDVFRGNLANCEQNNADLRGFLEEKERDLKNKKEKLKEFQKKTEILEDENKKINKIFKGKLQEIEDFKLRVSTNYELEEIRENLEKLKKTNMVKFLSRILVFFQ